MNVHPDLATPTLSVIDPRSQVVRSIGTAVVAGDQIAPCVEVVMLGELAVNKALDNVEVAV